MDIQVNSSGRVDFPGLHLESWVLIPSHYWNSESQEMPSCALETVTTEIA